MATEIATDIASESLVRTGIGRPTLHLPFSQLINLSVYWLGITAIWAGLDGSILPARIEELVGREWAPIGLAMITTAGVIMPILVQPTIGTISDYTITRWGRRKPYIVIGAVLDVVFLWAMASSNTFLGLVVFYVLLQFSSNFAQGPFQGYMPDLVPQAQVSWASGLMGLMIVVGQFAGTLIASLAAFYPKGTPVSESMFWPTVGLGLLELATALVIVIRVREGPVGLPREGRSWKQIALLAWGLDILRQRSFIWLVASRLSFLAATGVILRFALFYLERSMGMEANAAIAFVPVAVLAVAVPTALAVIPGARLSDGIGRKRVIFGACALGAIGLSVAALAPSVPVAVAALVPVGIGVGAFVAVDWALMTDIIPKATSGRYMGISNVGTAMAGPVGAITGGILIFEVSKSDFSAGPRAAFLLGAGFYVLAALLLRPVDATPRD